MRRCYGNDVMAYMLLIPMHDKELAQTAIARVVVDHRHRHGICTAFRLARCLWFFGDSRTRVAVPHNRLGSRTFLELEYLATLR